MEQIKETLKSSYKKQIVEPSQEIFLPNPPSPAPHTAQKKNNNNIQQ